MCEHQKGLRLFSLPLHTHFTPVSSPCWWGSGGVSGQPGPSGEQCPPHPQLKFHPGSLAAFEAKFPGAGAGAQLSVQLNSLHCCCLAPTPSNSNTSHLLSPQ